MMTLILNSIGVFLATILILVIVLLVAKKYLVPSGKVKLTINGDKQMEVESGSTLLNTLAVNGVFLSSACGGKGSCGQCKCQVVEGGGEILPGNKPLLAQTAERPLALGMPGQDKERHGHKGAGIDNGRKGMGMRSHIKQKCRYVHQRIYRGIAERRTHGLHTGFLRTDQDSEILYGL